MIKSLATSLDPARLARAITVGRHKAWDKVNAQIKYYKIAVHADWI